ncbi:hypothetical protein FF38_07572 [Lucilia cuprina]|uniref:Uncharacterized protein n=1 Tax=Lucilia cuprina TaxID=7375 RepID=A0A0L0BZK4_LUCCU|nr:hypothetical protein FF38_07572 [Lucilia cuprina]
MKRDVMPKSSGFDCMKTHITKDHQLHDIRANLMFMDDDDGDDEEDENAATLSVSRRVVVVENCIFFDGVVVVVFRMFYKDEQDVKHEVQKKEKLQVDAVDEMNEWFSKRQFKISRYEPICGCGDILLYYLSKLVKTEKKLTERNETHKIPSIDITSVLVHLRLPFIGHHHSVKLPEKFGNEPCYNVKILNACMSG